MAFSNGYIFGFAAALTVVCGLAVSSTAVGLKGQIETNKRRDVQGSILGALQLPEDGHKLAGDEIDSLWDERVEIAIIKPDGSVAGPEADLNGDGVLDKADADLAYQNARAAAKAAGKRTMDSPELLAVYQRMDDGQATAVAIPMQGVGLWGPISGYLALNNDASDVIGATFFAPKETPGLGAEITADKWTSMWAGKKVFGANGEVETIHVVKGLAANLCPDNLDHCVDGISGATLTGNGVDEMVDRTLSWYSNYLQNLRG